MKHLLALSTVATISLAIPISAHAHEVETQVVGYGAGPFGINIGISVTERALFTLGVDAVYLSSQAEGFSPSRIAGAVLPIGFKIYLTEPAVDTLSPFVRMTGYMGGGAERYNGERARTRFAGASTAVGVAFAVREALALGTEFGIGYMSRSTQWEGAQATDRFASVSWRMSLVFKFGSAQLSPAQGSSTAD